MGWFSVFSFIVSMVVQHQQQKKAKERQKKAEQEAFERADRAKGIEIVAEGEASPANIVYGRCLVGGIRVYHNTLSSFTYTTPNSQKQLVNALSGSIGGKKHEYLTVQQVISMAPINSCIWADVDKQDYNTSRFATKGPPSADYVNTGGAGGLRLDVHYSGNENDSIAAANYPSVLGTSLFPGFAFASGVFRLNRDDPQFGGVPTAQFYIEGLKVATLTESLGVYTVGARSYSNNPALVLLDYLTNTAYGKGLSYDEIDLESFYNAKVICDKIVQSGVSAEGKIWRKRNTPILTRDLPLYEANITMFSDAKIVDNIERILDTMDASELIWTTGKYKLLLQYPYVYNALVTYAKNDVVQTNSGTSDVTVYRSLINGNNTALNTANWVTALAATITDDDIIKRDEFKVTWPNASTRYNFATVRFRNEAKDFSEDSASWPPKTNFVPGAGVERGAWASGTAYNRSDYVTYGGNSYQLRFGESRVYAVDPSVDTTAWALVDGVNDVYRTYIGLDNGVELESSIFGDGIVDYYHALAKAESIVRSSRSATSYNITLSHRYGGLEPTDFMRLESDFLEIPGELLMVNSVTINAEGNVIVEASKFDARNLEWNAKDNEVIPQRNIYDSAVPAVTSLTLLASSNMALSSGTLSWVVSNDSRVSGYSIRYTSVPVNELTITSGMDELGVAHGDHFLLPSMAAATRTFVVIPMLFGKLGPFSSWAAISAAVTPADTDYYASLPLNVYARSLTTPTTPVGGTYNFDTFQFATLPTGLPTVWSAGIPAGTTDLYRSITIISAQNSTGIIAAGTWETPALIQPAVLDTLSTKNSLTVLQDNLGVNYGYANANGYLSIRSGDTNVTASTSFVIHSETSCDASINNTDNKGYYNVTTLTGNVGFFTVKATYNGRDVYHNIDVLALNVGAVRDTTPPPGAVGVTVTTGFSTVFIAVSPAPSYSEGHGHGFTVVYGAEGATPVFGDAVEMYRFNGTQASMPSTLGKVLKLWFKNISNDGYLSVNAFGGTNGIDATTGKINGVDLNPLIIEATNLADGAVGGDKLAIGAIAVGSLAVANGAITNAMIESLTADKILAGTLQATEYIQVGGKLKLFGDGYIESYSQAGYSTAGDYSRLDSGNLRLYRYVPALGYAVEYAYLRRYETGTAASGDLVTLPGYWKTQPKILVSPFVLKFFDPAYVAQGQSIVCEAQNIAETSLGSMQWRFTAIAYLTLSASTVNTVLNQTSGSISSNTYSSTPTRTTPANTASVTCNVELVSYRGNGLSQYIYRTVSWRIGYRVSGSGSAYSYSTPKVKSIGATTGIVTDTVSFTFPAGANTYEFFIAYTASDESASLFGSLTYEYATQAVSSGPISGSPTDIPYPYSGFSSSTTLSPAMSAYSAPSGWSIYSVAYSATFGFGTPSLSATPYQENANNICSILLRKGGGEAETWNVSKIYSGGNYFLRASNNFYGDLADGTAIFEELQSNTRVYNVATVVTGTYNPNYWTMELTEYVFTYGALYKGVGYVTGTVTADALITIRRPVPNSTTPANTFKFVDYTVALATAQVLATGTLNWMAIGD